MPTKEYRKYISLTKAKDLCNVSKCQRCKLAILLAEKHKGMVLMIEICHLDKYGNVKRIEYHAEPQYL